MRHAIVGILTMKSQEKVNFGGNTEEACATKEQIQESNTEDKGLNLEPVKQDMENKYHEMWYFRIVKKSKITNSQY